MLKIKSGHLNLDNTVMKKILLNILTFMMLGLTMLPHTANAQSQWWSYLAEYDKGAGSIRLDLNIKKTAPLSDYQYVIITGISYPSDNDTHLPSEEEMNTLYGLEEKVVNTLKQEHGAIHVGTLTYDNEQLYYFYSKDTTKVRETLMALYAAQANDRKSYINVREDINWEAYLDFLYPNKETIAFYKDDLESKGYTP